LKAGPPETAIVAGFGDASASASTAIEPHAASPAASAISAHVCLGVLERVVMRALANPEMTRHRWQRRWSNPERASPLQRAFYTHRRWADADALAARGKHREVEARIVGDDEVHPAEQRAELRPDAIEARRVTDVRPRDAVQRGVFEALGPWTHEAVVALDDLAVLYAHGADGARAVTETVGGLEIDRGENGHERVVRHDPFPFARSIRNECRK
jgi:hypothetical protein